MSRTGSRLLFGWLQVGEVLTDLDQSSPVWAADNSHVVNPDRPRNTLYVAAELLELGGRVLDSPGAGVFGRYDEQRRLTAPDARKRSLWQVPTWLEPRDGRRPLGFHKKPSRWQRVDDRLQLQLVNRGQEFVLDLDDYPEAIPWLLELFEA